MSFWSRLVAFIVGCWSKGTPGPDDVFTDLHVTPEQIAAEEWVHLDDYGIDVQLVAFMKDGHSIRLPNVIANGRGSLWVRVSVTETDA